MTHTNADALTNESSEQTAFWVWPDGTTQRLDDEPEPYTWMSDDYRIIWAYSEEEASIKGQE